MGVLNHKILPLQENIFLGYSSPCKLYILRGTILHVELLFLILHFTSPVTWQTNASAETTEHRATHSHHSFPVSAFLNVSLIFCLSIQMCFFHLFLCPSASLFSPTRKLHILLVYSCYFIEDFIVVSLHISTKVSAHGLSFENNLESTLYFDASA